jgi:hypothetical protein
MRTTLTLDDDISVLLEQRMAETGDTFKAIVNGLLRFALGSHAAAMSGTVPARKFSTPVFKGGQILAGEVSSTAELLALAEGESFK